MKKIHLFLFCAALSSGYGAAAQKERAVWTTEKANAWYAQKPWLRGCDFIPSTAINQLEMWQAGTFDPATIDRGTGLRGIYRAELHAGLPASCRMAGRCCGI